MKHVLYFGYLLEAEGLTGDLGKYLSDNVVLLRSKDKTHIYGLKNKNEFFGFSSDPGVRLTPDLSEMDESTENALSNAISELVHLYDNISIKHGLVIVE
jgi:hypothetical protein